MVSAILGLTLTFLQGSSLAKIADAKDLAALAKVNPNLAVEGETPLFVCVSYRWKAGVELLLKRGADVNGRSDGNMTALMEAADHSDLDVARILLEANPDLETRDDSGRTAINLCSRPMGDVFSSGLPHAAMTELLARAGAQLNTQDDWGRTPLINAAFVGRQEVFLKLLDLGADFKIEDKFGCSALSAVALNGRKSPLVIDLLHRGAKVGLMDALLFGEVSLAEELAAGGASLDKCGPYQQNVLSQASYLDSLRIVRLVLRKSPGQVRGRDSYRRTPLFWATGTQFYPQQPGGMYIVRSPEGDKERREIILAMIRAGADPNARTEVDEYKVDFNSGRTPIFYAAEAGSLISFDALVEGGAEVRVKEIQDGRPDRSLLDEVQFAVEREEQTIKRQDPSLLDRLKRIQFRLGELLGVKIPGPKPDGRGF